MFTYIYLHSLVLGGGIYGTSLINFINKLTGSFKSFIIKYFNKLLDIEQKNLYLELQKILHYKLL